MDRHDSGEPRAGSGPSRRGAPPSSGARSLLAGVLVLGVVACLVIGAATIGRSYPLIAGALADALASPSPTASATEEASPTPRRSPGPTPSPQPTAVATASPSPSPTPLPPLAEGTVPILYLHRVEAPPPGFADWSADRRRRFLTYDVIPAAFAAQLDWLRDNGYTTILPSDLAAHWDKGAALPPRPVIISLDDGDPSWMRTVLPLLKERGMVAEFYVTLERVRSGAISWAELRTLAKAGNGIGAHGVEHLQLAGGALQTYTSAEKWFQVAEPRRIIESGIGVAPDSMAYVGGGFDAELVRMVQRSGYTTARSVVRGIEQDPVRRFALRVVRVGGRDDVVDAMTGELVPGLPVFAAKMAGERT